MNRSLFARTEMVGYDEMCKIFLNLTAKCSASSKN
jgi:hypothetical protein